MPQPILRRPLLNELREYWVATTLRIIDDDFSAGEFEADFAYEPTNVSGERRTRVERYYHNIDWTNRDAVHRFISDVVQPVLARLTHSVDGWEANLASKVTTLLRASGFEVLDGVVLLLSAPQVAGVAIDSAADLAELAEMLRRIDRINEDPWLAIGTAKEIVETIARSVIDQSGGVKPPADADLPVLTKLAIKPLGLLADDVPEARRGREAIRRVLQGLAQVVSGTGELRNLYGTGHGPLRPARGVTGRHARLVVNAATAWADFVAETWIEQREKKADNSST